MTHYNRNFAKLVNGVPSWGPIPLTRRVYRNAGTGAFTYGNDLPYPIPA